jgi:VanZ family protein
MKKAKPIILALAVLTLLFIWVNSFMPSGPSSRMSGYVTRLITPFLEILVGRGHVTEHLVRKLAHVAEYALYAFWLALLAKSDGRKARTALLIGFLTAFLDETIQIFTGRGAAIRDVWIDLIGITGGIGAGHILMGMFGVYRAEKKKTEED